jgi:hypothetical protein
MPNATDGLRLKVPGTHTTTGSLPQKAHIPTMPTATNGYA